MKIIKNEKLIQRNGKIGNWISLGALLVLGGGMYISFSRPEWFTYSLICLVVGFMMTQIGMYMGNRWGRSPRPDERIDAGLKGLPGDYTLYHFVDPKGVAWFSQNLSETLKKDFDYYAIMAFHRQTMRELNVEEKKAIRLMGEVAERALRSARDPSQVMMKIQIMDWKTYEHIPPKEVDEVLTGILAHGNVSIAFVPYVDQFPIHLLKGKGDSPVKSTVNRPTKTP